MPERYDEPSPLKIVLLGLVLSILFALFFVLIGPAMDHEYDEMERRARDAQTQEEYEP